MLQRQAAETGAAESERQLPQGRRDEPSLRRAGGPNVPGKDIGLCGPPAP